MDMLDVMPLDGDINKEVSRYNKKMKQREYRRKNKDHINSKRRAAYWKAKDTPSVPVPSIKEVLAIHIGSLSLSLTRKGAA